MAGRWPAPAQAMGLRSFAPHSQLFVNTHASSAPSRPNEPGLLGQALHLMEHSSEWAGRRPGLGNLSGRWSRHCAVRLAHGLRPSRV